MLNQPHDHTNSNQNAQLPREQDYQIYNIDVYNNNQILYFDALCDMQEAKLRDIIKDPKFLAKFCEPHMKLLMFLSANAEQ